MELSGRKSSYWVHVLEGDCGTLILITFSVLLPSCHEESSAL